MQVRYRAAPRPVIVEKKGGSMPVKVTSWQLTSLSLQDAYTDFMLSRQAMNCTKSTLEFYSYAIGNFIQWIESQGITQPEEITARYMRAYIAQLVASGRKDSTVWDYARAVKTMLRFWHNEGYIPQPVKFELPKIAKRRLPVLSVEELQKILKACNVRDKAIILFMVDSGLRRAEVCALNWLDVDMSNGLVRVTQGKGRKDRSAVIGAKTRRALLAYRRTLPDATGAVFQTDEGTRFTGNGLLAIFRRLSKKTGIHVTPHALRRTFVILSLRNGMDVLHLQRLLGHADLSMVQHYAQLEDIDLVQAHKQHSPVDTL
jgi:site-specific recombinase XerD